MNTIRSGWRASVLAERFERILIGFDLRKRASLTKLFMTSYDDSVRYEEINEQHQAELSGLNLYKIDPSTIPSLRMPLDARVVAFDLPTDLVAYLSAGNVSNPQPLPSIKLDEGWQFIGFDVVDAITQTSGLYGVDWPPSGLTKIHLNGHGLIDDAEAAVKTSIFLDSFINEHAPFSPCGVWLKRT